MRLKKFYAVLCNGISDIGKGWLTASVGRIDPDRTLPVKIDPLLNRTFPQHLGVEIRDVCSADEMAYYLRTNEGRDASAKISEDMRTYKKAGMKVYPECNIVGGDLVYRFLSQKDCFIRKNEIKKRTMADLSRFLAEEIFAIAKSREPERMVVEVGGTIEDSESVYVPGALRFLGTSEFFGMAPEIVFLTYFDYSEVQSGYRVKTHYIRRGLGDLSRKYYGLPMRLCLARRRFVPEDIGDEVLSEDLKNVAYETQTDPSKVVLLPNVKIEEINEITWILKKAGLE